jgi:hypothetical protein
MIVVNVPSTDPHLKLHRELDRAVKLLSPEYDIAMYTNAEGQGPCVLVLGETQVVARAWAPDLATALRGVVDAVLTENG